MRDQTKMSKHTCFLDDESVKLTERLVAKLVGINQLSFLPWMNTQKTMFRREIQK